MGQSTTSVEATSRKSPVQPWTRRALVYSDALSRLSGEEEISRRELVGVCVRDRETVRLYCLHLNSVNIKGPGNRGIINFHFL